MEIVPFIKITNLSQSLNRLKYAGYWIVGLEGTSPTQLDKVKLDGKIVLVMGSEGTGLRRLTKDTCDILAKLPINPAMESLNVSNAAAIALYECYKQNNN
jgi:23S rRNA (guanosine2251-2'-O)-methyltransferase